MTDIKEGDTIVVWFSCGAASAVAAKKTIEKYHNLCKIHIVNNPVLDEHSDNIRFLKDVEKWLGVKIEFATNKNFSTCTVSEVFKKKKYISGVQGAVCTVALKKEARQQWEGRNEHDWLVLGYTKGEERRHKNFKMSERGNILPVLIEAGITKQDCFNIINEAGIKLPEIYTIKSEFADGFPNANCIGCVKSSAPTYWNHVRAAFPAVFERRAIESRKVGCKLVNLHPKHLDFCSQHDGEWFDNRTGESATHVDHTGKKRNFVRLFLDELPPHVKSRKLSLLDMPECGIFCEPEQIYKEE